MPVVRIPEVEFDEAVLPLVLSFQHSGTEADEHGRRLLGRSWPDYAAMARPRGPCCRESEAQHLLSAGRASRATETGLAVRHKAGDASTHTCGRARADSNSQDLPLVLTSWTAQGARGLSLGRELSPPGGVRLLVWSTVADSSASTHN